MKCPACEYDVPSGWSSCARCGAPLPTAGEQPAPGSIFGSPKNPQAGNPNPKTEPLPIPVWDVAEERPWNVGEQRPWDVPPERHVTPGTDAMPPEHHRDGWNLGAPAADPMAAGYDPATQHLGTPGTGPAPPSGYDPAGWDQGLPPVAGETPAPLAGRHTGKSQRMPLLAAGIAAVVVLGGLTYALTAGLPWSDDKAHTSTGKPGAGSAAQQAAAVNRILNSGKAARGHLPSRLRTCNDVSRGVPGFQQVVRDRQQELSQSRGLKVDRLRDGSRLRLSMIAAYQSSLAADQAYLAWAREIQARGCGRRIAPLTAHYKGAISANGKAGPAKRKVVALWKPIASSQGLPTYIWNRL